MYRHGRLAGSPTSPIVHRLIMHPITVARQSKDFTSLSENISALKLIVMCFASAHAFISALLLKLLSSK
jgi:hypothetical protein